MHRRCRADAYVLFFKLASVRAKHFSTLQYELYVTRFGAIFGPLCLCYFIRFFQLCFKILSFVPLNAWARHWQLKACPSKNDTEDSHKVQ